MYFEGMHYFIAPLKEWSDQTRYIICCHGTFLAVFNGWETPDQSGMKAIQGNCFVEVDILSLDVKMSILKQHFSIFF